MTGKVVMFGVSSIYKAITMFYSCRAAYCTYLNHVLFNIDLPFITSNYETTDKTF